jgi:hypothetical protein
MLTIRSEQLQAFEKERVAGFTERLVAALRETATRERLLVGDDWLQSQIDKGLQQGRRFELRTERQLARFIEATCFDLGGFPEGDWPKPALAILMAYGADGDSKVDRYCHWTSRHRYRSRP